MIAVDTNLLVYAHRPENSFHQAAHKCITELRAKPQPWAIPWPVVHEFIAVVTNPRIFKTPTPISTALTAIDVLGANNNLHFLAEGEGYFSKLTSLALAAKLEGARIHDARIAALCLHHGIEELWSADRDFSLFPSLKTRNPLVR